MITASKLQAVINLDPARAGYITDLLNELAIKYNLTGKPFAAFLANVIHESGGFKLKEENLNYSAKRLTQVWPGRFAMPQTTTSGKAGQVPPGKQDANIFANNPRKLANEVYQGRMGNNQPEDGCNFRGGGFIQLTGRDMFTKYGKYINSTPEEAAAKVRTEDYYALDSAFWFYVVEKKLDKVEDFTTIVKRINGGVIGLAEREKYYNKLV